MSLTKTVGLFAGTTLALTGAAFGSTEADNDALQQIADLKKQVAELMEQNGQNWLTEQRATEIKGLVQDVLADADTRASLQGGGSTAGYDNGFFISSADGNFRLNINGGAQMRWTLNHRDEQTQYEQTTQWGFQSRHANVMLTGHIVDPSWKYNVSFGFWDATGDYNGGASAVPGAIDGGQATLTDWWAMKDFGGWYLKAGQFVAPFSRERLMSDYGMQFVDRSNSAYVFGLGRTQGIEAGFQGDMYRAAFAYSDDLGPDSPSQNNGFIPGVNNSPMNNIALSGRFEVKCAGTWSQFEHQQSFRGEEWGFLFGIGGAWMNGRNNYVSGSSGGGDSYDLCVDATADFGGWNLYGAFFYAGGNDYAAANSGNTDLWGFQVQGGFFINDDMEIVARYEYGDMSDLDFLGGVWDQDRQSVLTLGFNWYFAKNRAKWQTDWSYDFQGMGAFTVGGNGWYNDTATAEGQWVFRTALTVNF